MMKEQDGRMAQYDIRNAADVSDEEWEELAGLTRDSFREREKQGLRMKPNQIYGEGLKYWARGARVIVARVDKVCAYALYSVRTEPSGIKFAYLDLIAVSPKYKRAGWGMLLMEKLEQECLSCGCIYIGSDTSELAESSVRFHLKCGFEKWSYAHYGHTNYYSVCFRKYLQKKYRPYFYRVRCLFDWIWVRMRCRESGQMGFLPRLKRHLKGETNPRGIQGEEMSLPDVQQCAYAILEYFVQFCQRYDLRYVLCYGSLLGAVRHKGFIPWDDDVDVAMPLPDYERFVKLFIANNTCAHLDLLHGVKQNAIIPFGMLVDKRTAVVAMSRDVEHTHPVAIDIFPAFAIDDDNRCAQQHINEIVSTVCSTHKCLNIARRNPLKYAYRLICNGFVSEYLLNKIERLMHRYSWGSTKRIRILSLGERELMALPADCFETAIDCEFEKSVLKIPMHFHELLRENYGEYMKLPPVEQRKPFSFKVIKLP